MRLILVAIAALSLPASGFAQPREQPKVYRYTDANGVVRYSDSIPPELASRDRDILNDQGVRVGFEEGEITEEEQAEIARLVAIAETEQRAKEETARRDNILLETYLSVDDIEDLRDRRLELLESQIKVTELYLNNLRKRLLTLQEEASNYKPYTARADAPQVPENLAVDLSRTTASINLYEQTLSRTRSDQAMLRESFDRDISRFRAAQGRLSRADRPVSLGLYGRILPCRGRSCRTHRPPRSAPGRPEPPRAAQSARRARCGTNPSPCSSTRS